MSSPDPTEDPHRALVPLLMRHERQIFAYIYTLLPNRHDAEDILQETCLTIYDKFAEFTQGTDFLAWAMRIAWWKVRAARQKFARSKVLFSDEVMEAVAHTAEEMVEETTAMHTALSSCLQKLNERDRRMILTRYERGSGVERAAVVSGRSLQAAYKALMRIKQVLHDCVLNSVSKEETA
jgi:RNA polymerase sigma-70 factor (ECF subfamily)